MTIRADQPGPKISRYIYGQFAEHLGHGIYEGVWVGEDSAIPNTRGYRNDVVAALKKLHVPVVRWPGGCFADEYHWRDGIGPRDQRPVKHQHSLGRGRGDQRFGTHEFMDFAELIGADAYVSGNVGSGTPAGNGGVGRIHDRPTRAPRSPSCAARTAATSRGGSPTSASATRPGAAAATCGRSSSPTCIDSSPPSSRRRATTGPMKIASGANVDDYNWTEVMMSQAAKHMDAYSLHYYTFPGTLGEQGPVDRLQRRRMGLDAQACAAHGRADHEARGDHGQVRSGQARRPVRRRMGHLVRPGAGPQSGLPLSAEHAARRAWSRR